MKDLSQEAKHVVGKEWAEKIESSMRRTEEIKRSILDDLDREFAELGQKKPAIGVVARALVEVMAFREYGFTCQIEKLAGEIESLKRQADEIDIDNPPAVKQ